MLCFGLIVMMWCDQPKPVVVSEFCKTAQIIRPSRKDTKLTLRAIAKHNLTVKRVCKK